MKKGVFQHLNLSHLEAALPQVVQAAQREQWTYETFLQRALAAELEGREHKAMARRLKAARLPCTKTLDGFDFSFQPTLSERRLRELADLSFVRTCTNIVVLGPPGTGKTHLSLALADRALTVGHAVVFTSARRSSTHLGECFSSRFAAPAPATLHRPQSADYRRRGLYQALAGASSSLLRAGCCSL
jgi:DNA replication protein DnaC